MKRFRFTSSKEKEEFYEESSLGVLSLGGKFVIHLQLGLCWNVIFGTQLKEKKYLNFSEMAPYLVAVISE